MKIFLMRHAEPESGDRNDPTRQLTEGGKKQAHVMGEFMAEQHGHIECIITSYFERAADTATIMADALGCTNVHETPWLEPNAPAEKALAEVNRIAATCEHILIITHSPLVNTLLKAICGAKTDDTHFRHGAIAHTHDKVLRWFVDPALVDRTEETAAIEVQEGWVTIDGAHVFIGDDGIITKGPAHLVGLSQKAAVARSNYSGGDKRQQDIAEKMENHLASELGMKKSSNNKPFDLLGSKYAVEVKTLVSNTNDKITMNKAAVLRKDAFVKATGLKPFTVVVDARGSTPTYFVRSGYGSFRIGSMTPAATASGIRTIMRAM